MVIAAALAFAAVAPGSAGPVLRGPAEPRAGGPGRTLQDEPGASRSLRDGVYTTEQAERGEAAFRDACAECHPTHEFPPPGYFESWEGATLDVLYELVRTTMPEDNPASLSRAEYADVFALLFSRSGWPAGETELASDAESLARIRIESPPE